MSYYRIYSYPLRLDGFKHIYFNFDRPAPYDEEKAAPQSHEFKLANNISRARRCVRDLIYCNYFDYFCTFTFSREHVDRFSFSDCKKRLTKWFDNFRVRNAPDFRYLIIPEFHKDGAIHFHGMVHGIPPSEFTVPEIITVRDRCSGVLKDIPNKKGYVRWERYSKAFGHFDCSAIKNYEACAMYVSKYITKELCGRSDLGGHLYFCSKGLQRPELVFDEDGIPCRFEAQYKDEFVKMAYCKDDFTLGDYLPDWWGSTCADFRQLEKMAIECAPMTVKQLSLVDMMNEREGVKNDCNYYRND